VLGQELDELPRQGEVAHAAERLGLWRVLVVLLVVVLVVLTVIWMSVGDTVVVVGVAPEKETFAPTNHPHTR
jgi:hypothetical protein